MKKLFLVSSFLMLLVIASAAMAGTVTVNRYDGYYTGEGGEFTLSGEAGILYAGNYASTVRNIGGTPSFQSFCVETNEDVGSRTYDFVPNTGAVNGGESGGNPDPVSIGTAWLYYQFSQGVLEGYDYVPGSGRETSAGLLQNTIWWLEGEWHSGGSTNIFSTLVTQKFGANATADNGGSYGYYPVGVLNLTRNIDGVAFNRQDQLVTFSAVPEPATIYLLGAGLVGFIGLRKKFSL